MVPYLYDMKAKCFINCFTLANGTYYKHISINHRKMAGPVGVGYVYNELSK